MNFYILSIETKTTKYYQVCCGNTYPQTEYFDASNLRSAFRKFICSWINPFEQTYLICSCHDIYDELCKSLMKAVKPYNFFIMKIDIEKYNGYLVKDNWEWIEEQRKVKHD